MPTLLITGANRGIGLEAAAQLASLGNFDRIILTARTAQKGEAAVKAALAQATLQPGRNFSFAVQVLDASPPAPWSAGRTYSTPTARTASSTIRAPSRPTMATRSCRRRRRGWCAPRRCCERDDVGPVLARSCACKFFEAVKKYSLRSVSRGATLVDTRPEPDDGARSAWSESGERGSAAAGGSSGAARVCNEEMCA